MGHNYSVYHGYCKECKEEVWGHWNYFDEDKLAIYCNPASHEIELPEDLLKELREDAID